MPDFNSVLTIPAILNGGAIVLIAMSFVWMMLSLPRSTARQEARVDKVIEAFRDEMRLERDSHHAEVDQISAAIEKGFTRVDTRMAVEEMKRTREDERKSRG